MANDADIRIRAPKTFLKVELDESRTLQAQVAPLRETAKTIDALNEAYSMRSAILNFRSIGSKMGRRATASGFLAIARKIGVN